MQFFIDRCLAPRIVHVLGGLGVTAIHQNDNLPDTANDDEIIEFVKRHDLVLVTSDLNMLLKHSIALHEHRPYVVFLSSSLLREGLDSQSVWIRKHWRKVVTRIEKANAPGYVKTTLSGTIEFFEYRPL